MPGVESGEPREVHHYALLTGYGAGAVNPYLAFATIRQLQREGYISEEFSDEKLEARYTAAKAKLEALKQAGEDSWEDIARGLDDAWEDLSGSVKRALERFKRA